MPIDILMRYVYFTVHMTIVTLYVMRTVRMLEETFGEPAVQAQQEKEMDNMILIHSDFCSLEVTEKVERTPDDQVSM